MWACATVFNVGDTFELLDLFHYFICVYLVTRDVQISPEENQNDLELDFKGFFLLILVVEAL